MFVTDATPHIAGDGKVRILQVSFSYEIYFVVFQSPPPPPPPWVIFVVKLGLLVYALKV